jgi:hypothetical protein
MRSKPYLLFAALLSCAALAAGCGGDDGGGGSESGSADDPNVAQTIANCKQSVDAAQGLSEDVKNELRDACEKASTGGEEAARKASQDVCARIVEETIPAGPAREAGVQACKQSNQ